MKPHLILAAAALFAASALSAQTFAVSQLDEEKYVVTCDDVTLIVDAAHGGKILSYRLGDREVIAQKAEPEPAPEGAPFRRRWTNPNSYGSTFWTSPQAEWNWPPVPEYDSLPYGALVTKGPFMLDGRIALPALRLIGQTSKYGYQVTKFITMDPTDGAIVITYSIHNNSGEKRKVAPWEITRVPNGGFLEFEAKPEDVTPADLMKVSFAKNLATLEVDVANENRKINVDGKGWLRFRDNGLVLTKRFPDIAPQEAAPGEAEIQVYIDARKTFVEIEAQGPYTELAPGERLEWTVRWHLTAE